MDWRSLYLGRTVAPDTPVSASVKTPTHFCAQNHAAAECGTAGTSTVLRNFAGQTQRRHVPVGAGTRDSVMGGSWKKQWRNCRHFGHFQLYRGHLRAQNIWQAWCLQPGHSGSAGNFNWPCRLTVKKYRLPTSFALLPYRT